MFLLLCTEYLLILRTPLGPGMRFGPDAIRLAFNNIEVFSNMFNIDFETINIEDLGNTRHTVVASEMIDMVYAMEEKQIRCMAIVEMCPPYDNGATASVAVKLMAEVIAMTHVKKPL